MGHNIFQIFLFGFLVTETVPSGKIHVFPMDLSSLFSIELCAQHIRNLNRPIHVLINNAGILDGSAPQLTVDGFERVWQVNHLGPVYFTKLLMPALVMGGSINAPSRVVMVSSIINHIYISQTGIDYDQLENDRNNLPTDPFRRYAETKLANILFAKELTKRMEIVQEVNDRDKVIGVSLHPGICLSSKLYRSTSYTTIGSWLMRVHFQGKCGNLLKERPKSIAQAAATIVYCAMHADVEAGQYYADCHVSDILHEVTKDETEWRKCWDFTENQIEQRFLEREILI